ncbi:copper resistance protein CopC [Modestobacter muralis]|uniref:Copper resistance protein CopC n=1 Tax=Modestobacter muralis TaxID=1608614 RepID=A0A6P0H970_9ACTN|nr:copper resistance protein CopC [Modestobacter muralis]
MLEVGALLAVFLGTGTSPAQAHDGLVDTTPLNTEVVTASPATVELTFTGEPLPLGTEVLVLGADGTTVSTGAAEIRGASVVQAVTGSLPSGEYTVEWRSTSSDGHPLTGSHTSTVAVSSNLAAPGPAVTGTTGATDTATATASAAQPTDDGLPTGWLVAGVLALGAVGALVALRRRA